MEVTLQLPISKPTHSRTKSVRRERCYECDQPVKRRQFRRSQDLYRATICPQCEPWVQTTLKSHEGDAW